MSTGRHFAKSTFCEQFEAINNAIEDLGNRRGDDGGNHTLTCLPDTVDPRGAR